MQITSYWCFVFCLRWGGTNFVETTDSSLKALKWLDKSVFVGYECFVYSHLKMMPCIEIFTLKPSVVLPGPSRLRVFAPNKSKNKKISVALLTKHKKRPLQRLNCFTPPFLLAETMLLHYLTVILPPWWFSLAFFTSLVWTDAAPLLLPPSSGIAIRLSTMQ